MFSEKKQYLYFIRPAYKMLKQVIIILFFSAIALLTNAQLKTLPGVNFGIAYRPELFELTNYYTRGGPNKGYHFAGLSYLNKPLLVFEINQRLNNERWSFQLSNYFSYNYLVTILDSLNRPVEDLNSFKYDVFVDVSYRAGFRKFKHSFIHISAGFGRMNMSKKFDYDFPTGERDTNGNRIFERRSTSLPFWAPRLSIGFSYRNLMAFVTAHGTPDEDLNPNPSLWVEYRVLYNIQLKKRSR